MLPRKVMTFNEQLSVILSNKFYLTQCEEEGWIRSFHEMFSNRNNSVILRLGGCL